MSSGTPVGRLKISQNGQRYSVCTIWRNEHGYSISLDKHSQQYPAMGPIDALKAWAAGAYLDYWPERPRDRGGSQGRASGRGSEPRNQPSGRGRHSEPDPFDDDDIPF